MLSSATNFLLGIFVARSTSAEEFGAFALAFAAYTAVLALANGLVSEPFVVRYSATDDRTWRDNACAAAGAGLGIGAALGAAALLVALAADSAREPFLALALTLPGLLLQDTLRSLAFGRARPDEAFVNDLVWAVLLVAGLAVTTLTGSASVFTLTVVWGLAATAAAVVTARVLRVRPAAPPTALRWVHAHRDLGGRYVAETMTLSGAQQGMLYGIGLVAGLAAVGAIRGSQILLGPIYVLAFGLRSVAVPEVSRVAARSLDAVPRALATIAIGVTSVALALGLGVTALAEAFGPYLLGDTWPHARPAMLPVALAMAGTAWTLAPRVGLRALADARRSLRARMVSAPLMVAFAVAGGAVGGGAGAAWGYAAAVWLASIGWWLHLRAALRAARELPLRRPVAPAVAAFLET